MMIKVAFLLVATVVCAGACCCLTGGHRFSRRDEWTPTDVPAAHNTSSATLDSLVHVDASSSDTQHPLVCGAGRDFPAGRELAFRDPRSQEFVHAVFPKGVALPTTLDGNFVLYGRYQTIRNRKSYTLKKPEEDYQYFVVSSWEQEK